MVQLTDSTLCCVAICEISSEYEHLKIIIVCKFLFL